MPVLWWKKNIQHVVKIAQEFLNRLSAVGFISKISQHAIDVQNLLMHVGLHISLRQCLLGKILFPLDEIDDADQLSRLETTSDDEE